MRTTLFLSWFLHWRLWQVRTWEEHHAGGTGVAQTSSTFQNQGSYNNSFGQDRLEPGHTASVVGSAKNPAEASLAEQARSEASAGTEELARSNRLDTSSYVELVLFNMPAMDESQCQLLPELWSRQAVYAYGVLGRSTSQAGAVVNWSSVDRMAPSISKESVSATSWQRQWWVRPTAQQGQGKGEVGEAGAQTTCVSSQCRDIDCKNNAKGPRRTPDGDQEPGRQGDCSCHVGGHYTCDSFFDSRRWRQQATTSTNASAARMGFPSSCSQRHDGVSAAREQQEGVGLFAQESDGAGACTKGPCGAKATTRRVFGWTVAVFAGLAADTPEAVWGTQQHVGAALQPGGQPNASVAGCQYGSQALERPAAESGPWRRRACGLARRRHERCRSRCVTGSGDRREEAASDAGLEARRPLPPPALGTGLGSNGQAGGGVWRTSHSEKPSGQTSCKRRRRGECWHGGGQGQTSGAAFYEGLGRSPWECHGGSNSQWSGSCAATGRDYGLCLSHSVRNEADFVDGWHAAFIAVQMTFELNIAYAFAASHSFHRDPRILENDEMDGDALRVQCQEETCGHTLAEIEPKREWSDSCEAESLGYSDSPVQCTKRESVQKISGPTTFEDGAVPSLGGAGLLSPRCHSPIPHVMCTKISGKPLCSSGLPAVEDGTLSNLDGHEPISLQPLDAPVRSECLSCLNRADGRRRWGYRNLKKVHFDDDSWAVKAIASFRNELNNLREVARPSGTAEGVPQVQAHDLDPASGSAGLFVPKVQAEVSGLNPASRSAGLFVPQVQTEVSGLNPASRSAGLFVPQIQAEVSTELFMPQVQAEVSGLNPASGSAGLCVPKVQSEVSGLYPASRSAGLSTPQVLEVSSFNAASMATLAAPQEAAKVSGYLASRSAGLTVPQVPTDPSADSVSTGLLVTAQTSAKVSGHHPASRSAGPSTLQVPAFTADSRSRQVQAATGLSTLRATGCSKGLRSQSNQPVGRTLHAASISRGLSLPASRSAGRSALQPAEASQSLGEPGASKGFRSQSGQQVGRTLCPDASKGFRSQSGQQVGRTLCPATSRGLRSQSGQRVGRTLCAQVSTELLMCQVQAEVSGLNPASGSAGLWVPHVQAEVSGLNPASRSAGLFVPQIQAEISAEPFMPPVHAEVSGPSPGSRSAGLFAQGAVSGLNQAAGPRRSCKQRSQVSAQTQVAAKVSGLNPASRLAGLSASQVSAEVSVSIWPPRNQQRSQVSTRPPGRQDSLCPKCKQRSQVSTRPAGRQDSSCPRCKQRSQVPNRPAGWKDSSRRKSKQRSQISVRPTGRQDSSRPNGKQRSQVSIPPAGRQDSSRRSSASQQTSQRSKQ